MAGAHFFCPKVLSTYLHLCGVLQILLIIVYTNPSNMYYLCGTTAFAPIFVLALFYSLGISVYFVIWPWIKALNQGLRDRVLWKRWKNPNEKGHYRVVDRMLVRMWLLRLSSIRFFMFARAGCTIPFLLVLSVGVGASLVQEGAFR